MTYVYDDAGRTVQMLDGTGTTTYSYDDLNRLTGTTHAGASVGYAWDDVSRLTALTYPSGDVVTRTYDDAGQLATVTDWADREFGFDWTDDGQLAEVSYPNGVVTSYDRDVAGQVTGLTAASQAGLDLLELAYGYSDAGLMTDRTTTRGTGTDSAQFAWDPLARLDAVTGAGAGDVGFDAAGSVTVLPDGRELTYDAGRQLTTLTVPGADDAVVSTGFTYDARGNRLTAATGTGPDAGTVTHAYDLANRLTSITSADEAVTTYAYDGNGLRATATTGGSTESFTWDLAAAYPLLLTDADHAYIYGTAGVPLTQVDLGDGAVEYLHTDMIGSVLTTTSAGGEVTAESDYDEYGLPLSVGDADPIGQETRFGYAGEYTDPTGYLYLRARYYDPTTAQFLIVDPLLDATGNPYGYTSGNPLQYADPLGLDEWWEALIDSRGESLVNNALQSFGAGFVDGLTGAINFVLQPVTDGTLQIPAIGDPNCHDSIYVGSYNSGLITSIVGTTVLGAKVFSRAPARATPAAPSTAESGAILRGSIPDQVAANLPEQMALNSARAGNGEIIIRSLGDAPRLVANYGPGEWVKMQNVVRGIDGNVTVHWFRNLTTGQNVEFKFTSRYGG